ncbi:PREDICTED: myosin light chain kinase 2, skeletal/cardiac muscle [Nipponia nippon]|uniref:myosin light chain kinase 2, skeletal/cardiac muscle n=1 Tax=Nipponia nippon TaxID=128390 RepID=UPI000510909F|nr:PREDICTED: myosin light chain kinase 2, skeletal/cardiac muscle [Nipponia nippon]
MEQGSGAGGTGGTAPPEADGGTTPLVPAALQATQPQGGKAAPMEGTVPAAGGAQGEGKDEPGQEKAAAAAAAAQDGGQAEPGKEKAAGEAGGGKAEPAGEMAPTAPEPGDGWKAAPAEEASAAQHDGGQAASAEEKVPAAAEARDGGKDEPGKEKAPAVGEPQGGQAVPAEGKGPAVAGARDGGKDEPIKEQAPGGLEAEGGGKAEPTGEKAPAAAEAEGGKAEPVEEKALAAAQARDGKEQPAKEKTTAAAKEKAPAAAKAQDGGKKAAKAEKTPADKKPAKEKAPATVKAQDGENKVAKAEKAPAAKKAQDGGKEEPAKEKAAAPAKEKAPAAAKAQDGAKAAAKAEKTPAAKKPQDGSKEEPAKEKAPAAAKVQDGGKKTAKMEKNTVASKAEDGGKEEPAKEKVPAAAKAQDGEKAAAKVEKTPAAKKAQGGGKEEPAKAKSAAPAKEKAPAAAKAQDGGKAEKTPAAKKPQDGSKEEPAKEKAPAAAKVQDGGKKAAKVEAPPAAAEAGDGGEEPAKAAATAAVKAQGEGEKEAKVEETEKQQQPRGPEPPRPALLQSLSCPAACQREEQPSAEAAAMEMIPEETTAGERDLVAWWPGEGDTQQRGLERASVTRGTVGNDVPPPPAPFAHRIVTLRSASVSSQYNLSSKEILGGGKFGEVHICTEKQTGLKLAAKVIRKQGAKDKEMVLLEIDVMNQLNHRNLIQLYDAIETPREIILFMEFVEGGELFERIIDDDYHLTEVDCMVFVRQICEGIRFMHHMRVLHLDLKPENILCVAATGHMVKIIDFGLARRYNPQEKLKVNFGTPEFLSPEVVNYEQVSYSTDMWSMGVITYMLLSGLSPFLGDNDTETLNNVLAANWYFDEETFESVSDEAKDFVSNLIIKEKSGRMSAGQCLQHPWLNNLAEKAKRCNRRLKSQVLLKKYVMRRRWKKNFIGVCAANRFKKITSSGSLTALGV